MKGFVVFRLKLYARLGRFASRMGVGRVRGTTGLYRYLYRRFVRPKGVAFLNIEGNKMYGADTFVGATLLMYGEYEKYETELFKNLVRSGMVVVDIGANIGYYTLIAAKLVGSKGVVYAFEPEPRNYELLCKNIVTNGYHNVVAINKAVSNTSGKAKLYVVKAVGDASSLARGNVLTYSKNVDCLEVETITLDDFFERTVGDDRIGLVKIDVEGAEGLVLSGAERVLRNNSLKILMEFIPDLLRNVGTDPVELLYKLQNYGFEIKLLNGRNQVLEPIKDAEEFCRTVGARRKASPLKAVNLLLEK